MPHSTLGDFIFDKIRTHVTFPLYLTRNLEDNKNSQPGWLCSVVANLLRFLILKVELILCSFYVDLIVSNKVAMAVVLSTYFNINIIKT